jgi:hypothetical protein
MMRKTSRGEEQEGCGELVVPLVFLSEVSPRFNFHGHCSSSTGA